MQSFLVSTLVVALAEIGDKTQLLALVLATRFRRPVPVILGIFFATLANHAGAAAMGLWISRLLPPGILRWVMGLSFLAFAFWTLIPDKLDDERQQQHRYGAFLTTLVAFFLVEIGDKTQVATVALAARFSAIASVVMGTTLGMLLANIPVVLLGHVAADRVPVNIVRYAAAAVFAVLGIVAIVDPRTDLW
jgi:putative Ca2+/H+ antiporter (TMEM165/GDT1 family)